MFAIIRYRRALKRANINTIVLLYDLIFTKIRFVSLKFCRQNI